MAFSKSFHKGQMAIGCGLCEEESKINWKCLNCNLLMCTKCKEKLHSKFQGADQHTIVNIKEVGKTPNPPNFRNIVCETHKGETCCLFCSSCVELVCPVCISKVHKGHDLSEISDGYKTKVENLKELLSTVQIGCVELETDEITIDELIKSENSKYANAKQKLEDHENALKEAVSLYTEEIRKELVKNFKTNHRCLQTAKSSVNSLSKTLSAKKIQIENVITSEDVKNIFGDKVKYKDDLNEIMTREKPALYFLPQFVPGMLTRFIVGTLMPTNIEVRVEKQLTTNLNGVTSLAVGPDNSLWISDKTRIKEIKSEGSILKCLTSYEVENEDLVVTPKGDLVLACNTFTLKRLKEGSSQCEDFESDTSPFLTYSLHITGDNKMLMGSTMIHPEGLSSESHEVNALLVVDNYTRREEVFAYDQKRERIFRYVKNVTTSRNGNIFVVDIFPTDLSGRVVVLDWQGFVINIYDSADQKENKEGKPFKPSAIVTTREDNIIVSDLNTHTLHVLNNYGNLIFLVDIQNIGIKYPTSLGFDSSGRLYIGCAREVGDVNLFQVCISGC